MAYHPFFAAPSTLAVSVDLLIVTSIHCSSSHPGIVATTSIVATRYFSFPSWSLNFVEHCGATLSKSTVAPSLRSCLARQVYPRSSTVVHACHCEIAFFVFHPAPYTHPELLDLQPQSSPDCRLPLLVCHPLLRSSIGPSGSNPLTADRQDSSFLNRVQSIALEPQWLEPQCLRISFSLSFSPTLLLSLSVSLSLLNTNTNTNTNTSTNTSTLRGYSGSRSCFHKWRSEIKFRWFVK